MKIAKLELEPVATEAFKINVPPILEIGLSRSEAAEPKMMCLWPSLEESQRTDGAGRTVRTKLRPGRTRKSMTDSKRALRGQRPRHEGKDTLRPTTPRGVTDPTPDLPPLEYSKGRRSGQNRPYQPPGRYLWFRGIAVSQVVGAAMGMRYTHGQRHIMMLFQHHRGAGEKKIGGVYFEPATRSRLVWSANTLEKGDPCGRIGITFRRKRCGRFYIDFDRYYTEARLQRFLEKTGVVLSERLKVGKA
ncbi:hypothetical protein BJ322DRAFT_1216555 [Thelephora terrestris]|uniref:Uncharacterized protein n=1 Tax=Thelephora terrestris TaxID=56493 RepID=A0A9P6HNN3_9AGAM|nr:hypothetical protein BJ322DRAFT_1216555 [Thelephora terrestris]